MSVRKDALLILLSFSLLLFYPVIAGATWQSSSDVHALLELSSALVAVTAGVMVLLHFLTTGRWFFLFVSIGLVQIGGEEFIHALFAFDRLWIDPPAQIRWAISTTWLTGRATLLIFFAIAYFFGKGEVAAERRVRYACIFNAIGFVCSVLIALSIFHSAGLSSVVRIGSSSKQLLELFLGFSFFCIFLLYCRLYFRRLSRSPLLLSIVLCAAFQVLVHLFVFDAQVFYDAHWDAAHLLKLLGYFFPIFGVWGETIKIHQMAKAQLVELQKEMSERQQAEARLRISEERLHLATEAAHLGIWDWDVLSNELVWDDAMYQLYGIPREQFTGTIDCWAQSLAPEDRERTMADVAAALNGERSYSTEFRVIWADGSVHVIAGIGNAIRSESGQALRMVGINFDVTERKRTEQELQQHRAHLEELVAQRTSALQQALRQAEAANQAKSMFLANMSHELRTPMNAILGYSDLMQRDSTLQGVQRDYLAIVNKSGAHLLNLINDVLDMAKIESGQMQLALSAFDLANMVEDVARMLRGRAEEKGLQLQVELAADLPRWISADERKLRQILVNLIGNAIKNTTVGAISVRLSAQPQDGLIRLMLDVQDSGSGIAQSDLAAIFEPFVQGGRQASRSGTGLGLPITREFVQLMGGTITVESTVGQGSVFHVEVNVEAAVAGAPVTPGELQRGTVHLAAGQRAWRILVADDQPENRNLLDLLLRQAGFQVEQAENGAQAVERFQSWQPDFIWMDWRMPVMDGIEAMRQIRELPGGRQVKIAAVSASTFQEQRADLIAAGMDDYVRKPYRADEIFDCMARLLGLEYDYSAVESPATTLEPGELKERLAQLPAELCQALAQALEILESERIEAAIIRVSEVDALLAQHLQRLAEQLDYASMLDALSCIKQGYGA
ncbi:response regulator [Aquipseudomonas campi]|uniref:histidine kinase n=1 Tax=Aquipseudomonas campi TaxID=2731681 RepID=A0A6M8FCX0_9GAMM|nr:ATP-binding protein [Pseudomonas campi]QKE61899.1 response regulator [Pseudomonas campi]